MGDDVNTLVNISEKASTVEEAKKIIKKYYDYECVFSDQSGILDGAHIFSAGRFPDLKRYPAVIIPVLRLFHREIDITFDPFTRIKFIFSYCSVEKKHLLRLHMQKLSTLLLNYNMFDISYKIQELLNE